MKKLFLSVLIFLITCSITAQSVFTLDGISGTRVYTRLDSAILYATDGDFLYLPGGNISMPTGFLINKRLSIFGAGHYPDSTAATGQTIITGNVYFMAASSGSMIQGVYIYGDIYLGNDAASATAKNILISRCSVSSIWLSDNGSANRGAENIFIKDNVIREGIMVAFVKNVLIETNIIEGGLAYGDGMVTIRNNIFLRRTANVINNIKASRFEGNIFLSSNSFFYSDCSGDFFYNNIFKEVDPLGATFSSGNQFNVTNLFVNQTGAGFSYLHDYHLTADSPAKNAGLDGTDCGIYGTNNPCKNGAVPVNPHIRSKNIPAQTDVQGKINVQITVGAQNN